MQLKTLIRIILRFMATEPKDPQLNQDDLVDVEVFDAQTVP